MSTPPYDPDDPRLTAYALGEATADERQAVEQLLAASPEARATVEQTRVLARLLEEDFARENAAYQQARPQPVVPANVIPFPAAQRRRWQPAVVWAWKAAAVFVAVASTVWLVGRRTSTAPMAAVQPAGRTATASRMQEAAPVLPDRPEPSASNDGLLAAVPAPEAQSDVAKLDAPPSAPLTLSKATPDAAPMLAEATSKPENTDELRAAPPDQEAPGGAPMLADRTAQAPPAAEAPLLAAARPAPPSAAPKAAPRKENRPEAAIVRLRQPDGTFVGGVLLTSGGRILAATKTSIADKSARTTVMLADGREFVADPGATNDSGLLRINAASLPSVRLAANAPDEGSPLLAARVDAGTGNTTIAHGRARRANGLVYLDGAPADADFVFNAAGELLATEQAVPIIAKSATRARAALRREVSVPPLSVRPFTQEERATLTRSPR